MPLLLYFNDRHVDQWTFRQVLERGVLVFECRNCWHLSEMDLLKLVERFGAEGLVGAARARMKCRLCNSKQVRSLVRLRAFRKDLAWLPAPPRARR
jgi:hypothetical protein